jgi:signal transduction histidine kinase
MVLDVTDRKRAEDELRVAARRHAEARASLEAADRRKDEFLGMLSHELRNPLAAIRNAAFILARTPPGSDPAGRPRRSSGAR